MALFQKKPQVSSSAPLYTLGLNKTILIVGLGNVGKTHLQTRHNIGFDCVDHFAEQQELGQWVDKKNLMCLETSGTIGANRVIVIKPTTMMNNSGEAVRAVVHFYNVPLEQLIVVHDELAIPFGQIRLRLGGSDAGNNGIKSVIKHLGPGFNRVRVGVHNQHADNADTAAFVLSKFSKDERAHMPALVGEVNAILTEYLFGSLLPHDTRSFIV